MPPFDDIPDAVQRLILEKLDSISQLEMLLLLHRDPERGWTADQIGTELRIDPGWAAEQLAVLESRGLVAPLGEASSYHFRPGTPEAESAVKALATCYADRRVAIIALLYSRPIDRIRVLADAFRVRRET